MAVVPGLVDAHQHPIDGALTHSGLDLSDVHTVPQLQDALRAARSALRNGEWLRGHSLAYEVFADQAASAELIEPAVDGAPALLTFFDQHTALASRAALAAAAITGPRAFEDTSEIVCVDGMPTGELREVSALGARRGGRAGALGGRAPSAGGPVAARAERRRADRRARDGRVAAGARATTGRWRSRAS